MRRIWTAAGIGAVIMVLLGAILFGPGAGQPGNPASLPGDGATGVNDGATAGAIVVDARGEVRCRGIALSPEAELRFVNGRLFLERKPAEAWLEEIGVRRCGTEPDSDSMATEIDGAEYIAINELCKCRNLWPVFDDGGVTLYEYRLTWDEAAGCSAAAGTAAGDGASADGTAACLRLEDIVADPTEDSRFTHQGLEKLRVMARWLEDSGQEYAIAWIPIYVSPSENITNDLTKQFNWYNADFLYTLDTLVRCGGHLGVHGLTHQYGEDASAAGWEFGADSPFSTAEAEQRMVTAKELAKQLGYEAEFFEFPHYAMTREQGRIAERHFNVIYQQEPWTKPYGYVETKRSGGRAVMYVPTPADCVHSEYDREGILERLAVDHREGRLVSLFFHPNLDYARITCAEETAAAVGQGIRILTYDEERGILPALVTQIQQWNMNFAIVW